MGAPTPPASRRAKVLRHAPSRHVGPAEENGPTEAPSTRSRAPYTKTAVQSEARTPSLARWKAPRSFRLPGEIRRAQLFTTCLPSGFNALYGIRCLRTPAFCEGNHLGWYFG